MSLKNYDLICRDCRVNLGMGSPVNDVQGMPPDRWLLTGISSDSEEFGIGPHICDDLYCRVVAKFLIIHRNHRLSFIPSEAIGYLEEIDGGWYHPVSSEELLAQAVEPELSTFDDVEQWRQKRRS